MAQLESAEQTDEPVLRRVAACWTARLSVALSSGEQTATPTFARASDWSWFDWLWATSFPRKHRAVRTTVCRCVSPCVNLSAATQRHQLSMPAVAPDGQSAQNGGAGGSPCGSRRPRCTDGHLKPGLTHLHGSPASTTSLENHSDRDQ